MIQSPYQQAPVLAATAKAYKDRYDELAKEASKIDYTELSWENLPYYQNIAKQYQALQAPNQADIPIVSRGGMFGASLNDPLFASNRNAVNMETFKRDPWGAGRLNLPPSLSNANRPIDEKNVPVYAMNSIVANGTPEQAMAEMKKILKNRNKDSTFGKVFSAVGKGILGSAFGGALAGQFGYGPFAEAMASGASGIGNTAIQGATGLLGSAGANAAGYGASGFLGGGVTGALNPNLGNMYASNDYSGTMTDTPPYSGSGSTTGSGGSLGGIDWNNIPTGSGINLGSFSGASGSAGSGAAGSLSGSGWLAGLPSVGSTGVNLLGSAATGAAASSGGGLLSSLGSLLPSGSTSSLLSGGLNLVGGLIQGNSAQDAAEKQAEAILRAAQISADAAKFRPIGITSRFGKSNFGYDAQGNLNSAGYTLSPEAKAQQDMLMGISNDSLLQYKNAMGATAPMGQGAQTMFDLGNSYLSTTPQDQAAKYMQEQQALLSPTRQRDMADLQARLYAQGRLGVATGATTDGMNAANPELEAYYNSLRQQDLGLAANATQGGMDYAKFGAGMLGSGSDMLNSMYATQSAAANPYQTALNGAVGLESLGQGTMDAGTAIGAKTSTAGANAGQMLMSGANNAAASNYAANSYSPWGTLLSGAGNAINSYTANNTNQSTQSELIKALLSNQQQPKQAWS